MQFSAKPRAVLVKEQVMDIFRLSAVRSPEQKKPTATSVAKKYGVNEKTIRDIWRGRTWHEETLPLDADRIPKKMAKTGRPLGRKDRAPRKSRRTCLMSPNFMGQMTRQETLPDNSNENGTTKILVPDGNVGQLQTYRQKVSNDLFANRDGVEDLSNPIPQNRSYPFTSITPDDSNSNLLRHGHVHQEDTIKMLSKLASSSASELTWPELEMRHAALTLYAPQPQSLFTPTQQQHPLTSQTMALSWLLSRIAGGHLIPPQSTVATSTTSSANPSLSKTFPTPPLKPAEHAPPSFHHYIFPAAAPQQWTLPQPLDADPHRWPPLQARRPVIPPTGFSGLGFKHPDPSCVGLPAALPGFRLVPGSAGGPAGPAARLWSV
jgi:hypothetical protein